MRWSIQLQEFNLQIKYIRGKDNIGADTLTRYVQVEEDQIQTNQQVIINQLVATHYNKKLRQQLKKLFKLQQKDSKIIKIKQRIERGEKLIYQIYNGLIFHTHNNKSSRIMIPEFMASLLVREVHEEYGHCGTTKVYQLLKKNYQLRHMKTIKRVTQTYDLCQKKDQGEDTEVIIQLAYKKMKRMTQLRNQGLDKGKTFMQYTVGQQILVKEHGLSSAQDHEIKKLFLLYRGPYTIIEIKKNNTVVVLEEKKSTTYNMQNIKPYTPVYHLI
ncbi:hypothetical protein AGLY_017231 [Aphis glycines]|uniref:Integrase zinc-binding domain-containing protein n=1 Tax=Aphis glycines TaxID=307491 RepID=A0A6G0SVI2_APHGL|nr:hypothetical protein AGLY_017231 [Aphis glycines]